MIPRILHQIWVGPNPLPEDFRGYRESWRRHHPDWDMPLWTEANLPTDFTRKEAYERLRVPAERCDIILLELLLRHGGVYVDTDLECLRSIDPLLDGIDFCVTYNKPGRVSTALIAAIPGHPIIEQALRDIRPRTEYGVDKHATGPGLFTRVLREYPEVTIFPHEYFHAFEANQRAYAVNHRAHSGMEPAEARKALVKADRKLAAARERIEELERRRPKNRIARLLRALRATLATPSG
jgi:mannosyltransferase OCH1-like enzyme